MNTLKTLNNHELLVLVSSLTPQALLHIHYDKIDEMNHKSLNSIVHVLNDSGYHDLAQALEKQTPYVVFDNAVQAVKAREFLNDHSAAVYASIFYKGVQDNEVDTLVHKEHPEVRHSELAHFRMKK